MWCGIAPLASIETACPAWRFMMMSSYHYRIKLNSNGKTKKEKKNYFARQNSFRICISFESCDTRTCACMHSHRFCTNLGQIHNTIHIIDYYYCSIPWKRFNRMQFRTSICLSLFQRDRKCGIFLIVFVHDHLPTIFWHIN